MNSNWTDKFSTEARFLYKSQEISQTPLNGLGFAQFSVCTDATSITVANTANNNNNVTSCGNGARVFLGPDASRQYNSLFFDTWGGSLQARYNAGSHDIKILPSTIATARPMVSYRTLPASITSTRFRTSRTAMRRSSRIRMPCR